LSPAAAREVWVEHRFFKYRGCAPDPDDPRRMVGDPGLGVGAHHGPDVDGGEPQADRVRREQAAVEVCLNCPVMVQCDAYANSVTAEGKLAEPDGVWGGRTALERHKAFIRHRHEVAVPAPDRMVQTKQKMAVLRALAVHTDPWLVAAAAGRELGVEMDLRTAKWQLSRLVTQFNLCKTSATRRELLGVAVERGLLDAGLVVEDDGTVPAVPPTRMPDAEPRPRPVPMPEVEIPGPPPVPMPTVPSPGPDPVPMPSPEFGGQCADRPLRLQSPRRDRFTDVHGQLALWEAELSTPELAAVHALFPSDRLEAAA
jgi:hypothetical protein